MAKEISNLITFNTYKFERGGLLVDMFNQFNARVGDQGTELAIQWETSKTETKINLKERGLHFFGTGSVGQYLEKLEDGTGFKMSADASTVEWEDKDEAGSLDDGITVVKLPKQFFPQKGIFFGYFGLKDRQGNIFTSVNVWFRVLGGVPTMGAAIPYFVTEFDEVLERCNGKIIDALAELREKYQAEVKKNEDMSAETRAALSKLADAVGAIQAQIDAGNVITRKEYNNLANQIDNRLSKMTQNIESFSSLDDLKAQYPNGKDGLFVTNDNNHKYQYKNGSWVDEGIWTVTTFDPETRRRLTYLDTSNSILQKSLSELTKEVVDINWFLGEIDANTGKITPHESFNRAYSSLKVIGKSHAFEFLLNTDYLQYISIFEFNSNGEIIKHDSVGDKAIYTFEKDTTAVRFQITSTAATMKQNDLRDTIQNSGLKIIDRGHRSVINDIDHLYIREHLMPIEAIEGYTINTNVDYGETVDVSHPIVTSAFQYINQVCKPGDIFVINNLSGGFNAMAWAFIDSENRLIQKSEVNLSQSQVTLYAPSNAAKLIINNMDSNCTAYRYTPDKEHLAKINIALTTNIHRNIKLAYQTGETVSLIPEKVSNYKYIILDCNFNDAFRIKGYGGLNPRLYGFISEQNTLMNVAPANVNDQLTDVFIKTPKGAKKLVVNFNLDQQVNPKQIAELYKLPDINVITEQKIKKNLLNQQTVDTLISSYMNGILLGKDLANHLADFAKSGDKMVHVSTFYKVNDTLFMSYYANTRSAYEDPTQHTARLVYAPFENLNQQTYIDVADIGQEYNGQKIEAIYDSLLLKTSDDSYMIYAFTAKVGGKFYMLYRRFDPKTKLLSDIHTMNFKVGVMTSTFDTVSVHDLLAKAGIDYDYEDRDISFVQKLSPRIEDGVVQYYAGIGILHFCFVVKSSDLINWTFVSTPDFMYKPEFEPSVYVKGDNVYYFCRQRGTEGNAVLAKYNIPNGQWSNPILVPDTQSRYDFFENNSQLYLVHSPLDRNHISLMQIDQNVLEKSYEVATAVVQDCFYPFTQNIDGQMYMSFTQSRQHIWLNKFNPHSLLDSDVATIFSNLIE
ncbi:hypothetical protein [Limosilactobacillus reuteri]|uniref:hypothetical protein n=1 Tax=Limosilactobacillus reuteri TaxID=1598 RepID=UPI001E451AD2|nr:hypothetical protein [Limosilactobacillus reuteri]UFK64823.1 hypothetical protein IU404_00156 [Limosilactobacillus reuteri]UFK68878.1 hypothetical protein IVR12_01977 [Limosilactobacillus reuteri]